MHTFINEQHLKTHQQASLQPSSQDFIICASLTSAENIPTFLSSWVMSMCTFLQFHLADCTIGGECKVLLNVHSKVLSVENKLYGYFTLQNL